MAIKAKMSVAEAVLQLIRGFKKVTGREPSGLELIKIQQEAVERLKELEKVVDMQGNVIDTSKGIMGGRQIQESKEFGKKIKETYDKAKGPGKGQEMVDALKSPGAKKSYKIMGDQLGVKLYGDETFDEILEIQRTGKHPRGEPGSVITSESLKKRLMEGKNPFSDLVKTTDKGPKTLEQRRKEAQKALRNKNVVPIEGKILDKQIKQEFDKGMKEGKFKDIRLRDGREIKSEDDFREYIDELNEDSNFATGGRAGFANGGEGLMSLADKQKESLGPGAPSIKYDFDREGPGPMGPPFETDDPEEAAREIVRRLIRIEGAQIPISKKGQLGIAIPKLDTVGAGGLINLLGGELEVGGMKDFGSGLEKLGFEFRKKFGGPKGERVKRKEGGGMSRRKFMKIMGGLAALPIVGKFFKSAKPVAKVADVVTKTTKGTQPPEYFFDLAAKIKILGKESSAARRERMVEVNYKNYTLEEDLVTGDMTIVKRKGDPEFGYEEEVMALRKGQADEMTKGKTPPDEYEELTVRPDPEGKMKDVEDGIEPESVKEIMEEVGQGGGNLDQTTLEEIVRGRLASGGRASFSKGGIRTYLKNLLNFLAEKEGLKGSDQLRALNPKSFPRKIRTRMTAKQLKDVEANRAEYLQSLLDMLEADKRNMAKMKGTADQVFKQSMKEAVAAGDTEKIKLLKKAGKDLIREEQEKGIPYLKILRQFDDTNIDDTISEGQKMLKDFQIKKGLRKLNASGGVAMMLGE